MILKTKRARWLGLTATVVVGGAFIASCGSGSGAVTSAWLETFATGMAISSPTATTSTALRVNATAAGTEIDPDAPASEKAEALEDIATAKTLAGCKIILPTFPGLGQRADCYGPSITYSNHPDCTGGMCTADDNTTNVDANNSPNDTDGDGSLPTGDLGLYNKSESDDNACAAAQMNKLTSSASAYVDASSALHASATCVLANSGTEIPAEGVSTDIKTLMTDSLPTTVTLTTATVTNHGTAGFTYAFEGTNSSKAFKVTIKHNPGEDATKFTGIMYGYFTNQNKDSFSVVYEKSGDDLKARLGAGSWNTSTTEADMFDSSGLIKMGGNFFGNMNHAVINTNMKTNVSTVSYAWQAGANDSNTRVFNVYTKLAADGTTLEGCGYFGYGAKLSSTLASNTNAITGFICNWAGPSNNHSTSLTTHASKAQKQCFTKSSEKFAIVEAKNNILYWPSNSCDKGSGPYTFAVTPYQDVNATGATSANNLVTTTSDTDFSSYTAPAAPTAPALTLAR